MKKVYVWMAAAALMAWVPVAAVQAEGNHQKMSDHKAMAGHSHASHHQSDCDKDKKADTKASGSKDGKHAWHERTDNPED